MIWADKSVSPKAHTEFTTGNPSSLAGVLSDTEVARFAHDLKTHLVHSSMPRQVHFRYTVYIHSYQEDATQDTTNAVVAFVSPMSSDTSLSTLSMDALEDEIGSLSSHLNAATYRLLLLIAELDRREPWGTFGCKTCARYLHWKCGIALSAAREKVRTARALGDLALISQAFGAGRISNSKARALTRVANAHNERGPVNTMNASTLSRASLAARRE